MPRKDDDYVTTTIQLERASLERLEKVLIGKRDRMGHRISKRAVFQFLLDRALKDKAGQEQMFLRLHETDQT